MNISDLLQGIAPWPSAWTISITGICEDSRTVRAGDLFIAYAGPQADRPRFIQEAIKRGAVAVLREAQENLPSFEVLEGVPVCAIPYLDRQVASIAARFYHYPAKQLRVIGITGTNGKTSCTLFIARLFAENQIRCGMIGTLGAGFPDAIVPGTLTTPGAIQLQNSMSKLLQQGATHIAMEVSSHSLVQHRVAEIPFEIAVFTNLTRDHLDYHGSMQAYAEAKRLLFLTPHIKHAVINADDAFGRSLLSEFAPRFSCYAYSVENQKTHVPTVYADKIQLDMHGFSAHIHSPWGEGVLYSALLGRFNISNLLAALTTLCVSGFPFPLVLEQLSRLSTVPGRMQCMGGRHMALVVVDYAHTPDALEKALLAIRAHTQQKIYCVFGCGGDRDQGKRPLMGKVAASYSDYVIVTDDNPRFEDPKTIADSIVMGIEDKGKVMVQQDRPAAIAYAITHAEAGDVVLIAGKGHETYQLVGDTKIHSSDVEIVQFVLDGMEADARGPA